MLILRHVTERDLRTLYERQRDPEATRMAAFPARPWDTFLEHWRTRILADAASEAWAIVLDGDLTGYVASWESEGKRLVGYWIGKAFWGRGIAPAALRDFLKNHELTRPIHAYVACTNTRSMRVLEKCGFRRFEEPTAESDGVAEILYQLDAAA